VTPPYDGLPVRRSRRCVTEPSVPQRWGRVRSSRSRITAAERATAARSAPTHHIVDYAWPHGNADACVTPSYDGLPVRRSRRCVTEPSVPQRWGRVRSSRSRITAAERATAARSAPTHHIVDYAWPHGNADACVTPSYDGLPVRRFRACVTKPRVPQRWGRVPSSRSRTPAAQRSTSARSAPTHHIVDYAWPHGKRRRVCNSVVRRTSSPSIPSVRNRTKRPAAMG
jgi:hypothetical protein